MADNDAALQRAGREEPRICELAEHHTPESIRRLLSIYPRGGDGLTFAVYNGVVENPAAARYMVVIANLANPEQMTAIALGLLRALDRLAATGPECPPACSGQGGAERGRALPAEARRRNILPGKEAPGDSIADDQVLTNFGDACGDSVRAALRCAEPSLDAVMAALARQSFAVGGAQMAGHCNAPIYAGAHSFSGGSAAVAPPVSRN